MRADPDAIPLDAVAVASFEVRRRRYGDERWLVRHNEAHEIDPTMDTVWQGCVDRLAVGAIGARVAAEHALAEQDARRATLAALAMLAEAGFVTFESA